MKLTKDQFQFLKNLTHLPQTAVDAYMPARKLLELGYATREEGGYTWTHTITEAGKAHYNEFKTEEAL